MNFPSLPQDIDQVSSLSFDIDYIEDLLPFYRQQTLAKPNSLLLESAEIDRKIKQKSLLLLDCALRLECWEDSASIRALTANGMGLLKLLARELDPKLTTVLKGQLLVVNFPAQDQLLDEDSRLLQLNQFSPLRLLQQKIKPLVNEKFSLILGGALGYDMPANLEPLPRLQVKDNSCPDYLLYLAETLLIVDHQDKSTRLVANLYGGDEVSSEAQRLVARLEQIKTELSCEQGTIAHLEKSPQPLKVMVDCPDDEFAAKVEQAKDHIRVGDVFQVVLSRTFSIKARDQFASYDRLRHSNPSPYMFFMRDEEFDLLGASPESAVKYDAASNQLEAYPIAGTRRRGFAPDGTIDKDLDNRIELELLRDEKENAEHIMLVDLARNDLARVCQTGTRHIKELLKIDRYSVVMHLVSRVIGQLRPELDALHAYQACMNIGTLVGAPKIRAAQLIAQYEGYRRGSYGGAVGYMLGCGDFDSCTVIRSAFVKNSIAYIQAGCGIVYDSDPISEAKETKDKAQAVINSFLD